jgi:hypothetical protein
MFPTSSVPVSSGSALLAILVVHSALNQAFRAVTNFSDHAFLDSAGNQIAISLLRLSDVSTRPAGILTYRFRATIRPSTCHAALADFPLQSIVFSLALPQSQVTPANSTSDPTSRVLFRRPAATTLLPLGTPSQPSVSLWNMRDTRNRVLHDTENTGAREVEIEQITAQFQLDYGASLPTRPPASTPTTAGLSDSLVDRDRSCRGTHRAT